MNNENAKQIVRGMSPITIYCDSYGFEGLVLRYMLSIKGIKGFDMVNINHNLPNPELLELSSVSGLPLMAYETSVLEGLDVIMNFLDENTLTRNPCLTPDDANMRARYSMYIFRIVNFWQDALNKIASGSGYKEANIFLKQQFNELSPSLNKGYFHSNVITMVDVYLVVFIYMLSLLDFDYSGVSEDFIRYRNEKVRNGNFLNSLSNKEKSDFRFVVARAKYNGICC